MRSKVVTIDRHIIDQERNYPGASGSFSAVLYDIALAAKIISREVNMAGLIDVLGMTGETNVQGEKVRKLDAFAQEVIVKAMDHAGHLCCMVSEESEDIIPIPKRFDIGNYVLLFDPLDGSSNIDVNVSIGTIFSIHHRVLDGRSARSGPGTMADCLQPGFRQVAAGYVIYGSSTMLVYTTGVQGGVHGFTLDPVDRRIPAESPRHPHPRPAREGVLGQRGVLRALVAGTAAPGRPLPRRERGRWRGLQVAIHRFAGLRFSPHPPPGRDLHVSAGSGGAAGEAADPLRSGPSGVSL